MTVPLVSVVVPCFNNVRYVGAAIDSVVAQDVADVEVIVVDDGSTDGSGDAAAGFGLVRLLRQENQGSGSARNRGVAAATGTYVAFLDADDLWAPGKLRAQLDLMAVMPTVDIAYARIEEFVSDDLSDEERAHLTARPGRPAVLLPSTILMPRNLVQSIGFESGTGASESIDWTLRVREAGLVAAVAPDALVYRRIHNANTSRLRRQVQRSTYLHAIKRSLDRRRAAGESPGS